MPAPPGLGGGGGSMSVAMATTSMEAISSLKVCEAVEQKGQHHAARSQLAEPAPRVRSSPSEIAASRRFIGAFLLLPIVWARNWPPRLGWAQPISNLLI